MFLISEYQWNIYDSFEFSESKYLIKSDQWKGAFTLLTHSRVIIGTNMKKNMFLISEYQWNIYGSFEFASYMDVSQSAHCRHLLLYHRPFGALGLF